MQRAWVLFLIICAIPLWSYADIVSKAVDYSQGGEQLQGWLVYDDSTNAVRPGIVVFPEWWGLNDYAKHRAEQLAKLGYVAFAADMYGKGIVTQDSTVAPRLS